MFNLLHVVNLGDQAGDAETIAAQLAETGRSLPGVVTNAAGKTLPRGKFSRDLAALQTLIAERGVKGIVIGLPLNMDGTAGPRAQATRAFARNLAPLGLPILCGTNAGPP